MRTHTVSRIFYSISVIAVLYALFISHDTLGFFKDNELNISKPSGYPETITVVIDKNFVPFSFMTKEGELTGAMIELLYAMAHEMRVNVKLVPATRQQALQMVKHGEADVLFGLEYTNEAAKEFEITEAAFINQFVAFGREDYYTIDDLLTKRLGIFTYNLASKTYLTPLTHMHNVTAYSDHDIALQDLLDGKIDYLIGRYAIGVVNVKLRENMQSIQARGDVITTSAFRFGLTKGHISLTKRMDKALLKLQQNGVRQAIADKWLNTYSADERVYQFIRQHKKMVIPFLFFFLSFICIYCGRYIQNLHDKSRRDIATGLYNKKETEHRITKCINNSSAGMMVVVDIDDFKSVNDTFGHDVGDDCILYVAKSLCRTFRSTDIIGRIGGDEFMVYAPDITTEDLARKKIEQVLHKFASVANAVGDNFPLHVSVGFALHKPHEVTFAELYKLADTAMYKAKHTGKNNACFSGDLQLAMRP